MVKKTSDDGIYRIDSASKQPRGTRRVREYLPSIEVGPGIWNSTYDILDADGRLVTRRAKLPYGPRPVPPKDLINFIGEGSGFHPDTPRMRLGMRVTEKDAERPLEDVRQDGWFRSGTWVTTAKAKDVLISCDADGFECLPIQAEFVRSGEALPAPEMWLCDLVRFVSALEDDNDDLVYFARRDAGLRFRAEAIGGRTFFRESLLSSGWIFCTEVGRRAIIDAGLTGLQFEMWGRVYD